MKAAFRYGLAGAGGYLLFLAATAPARLAVSSIPLPPSMALTAVHGSVWSGRAVLTATGGQGTSTLSHLKFHVWPGALLHGHWGYIVQGRGVLAGHASVAVGARHVELAQAALRMPAAMLGLLATGLRDAGATGEIVLRDRDWVGGRGARGGGVVIWRHAGLASAPVDPLGSYRLSFRMTPAGAAYTIHTIGGKLAVSGRGHYRQAGGTLSFTGLIAGHGLRLQGFLGAFGSAGPGGARQVHLRLPVAAL